MAEQDNSPHQAIVNKLYGSVFGNVEQKIEVASDNAGTIPSASDKSPTSPVHLSTTRGTKIDFIRVVNTLYELGFFTDDKGGKISKKEVMIAVGKAVNIDLTEYQNDLSRSLSDSTALEKHLRIFDQMRRKMEDVFNAYGG